MKFATFSFTLILYTLNNLWHTVVNSFALMLIMIKILQIYYFTSHACFSQLMGFGQNGLLLTAMDVKHNFVRKVTPCYQLIILTSFVTVQVGSIRVIIVYILTCLCFMYDLSSNPTFCYPQIFVHVSNVYIF